MKYTDDEIQRVLRTLDPAGDGRPLATAQRVARDRAAIMSGGRPVPHRNPVRQRRLVLAGAGVTAVGVVAAVVAGSLFVESAVPDGSAAFAATPDPLVYTAPASNASAAGQLEQIAARTERLPAERTTGFEHIKMSAWYLDIAVAGNQVSSLVVPMWTETWRAPDGTGTMTTGFSKPKLRTPEEHAKWERLDRPGENSTPTTEALQPTPRVFNGPAPADRDALARYLTQGHPPENGPGETVVAIADLVCDRVLGPAQRAALLRVLATVPGLTYAGETTDRAGRKGAAFTLRNRHGGLLNDHTLVVDPASGRLLDSEVLLLEQGKLDVRVPGIVRYELYLTSEFTDR
ncbi:hypothetical protein GCM10010399_85210 [Dactylosporangium fulvum]|uniref:CU044_5270 family protein n=1 Tax=Dactylosporangium fulvum TaxID=53359 RepID=A0ABY5VTL9_9ACTN|nr:CU044_5270 family protein [Dactylosporangium fulvum]UWP81078.1 CU044_5270 family protein [Dactylosporangium fulvum]